MNTDKDVLYNEYERHLNVRLLWSSAEYWELEKGTVGKMKKKEARWAKNDE